MFTYGNDWSMNWSMARAWHFSTAFAFMLYITAGNVPDAEAGELHLLINGKAIHFNKPPNSNLNEKNWGAGFQYDFDIRNRKWVPFVMAAGFNDSNRNASYYAGGGLMRRFYTKLGDRELHYDVGGIAFLMTRKNYRGGDPFLGILPAFSVGTDRFAVNITYIPRIDPKSVPLLFFQLKIQLKQY